QNVGTPGLERERQPGAVYTVAEDGQAPILPFPAVAIRAMEDRAAVTGADAGKRRQIIDDPGGDQQEAGGGCPPVFKRCDEAVTRSAHRSDADAFEHDTVANQFRATKLVEDRGSDTVARQVSVQR